MWSMGAQILTTGGAVVGFIGGFVRGGFFWWETAVWMLACVAWSWFAYLESR